MAKLLFCTTMPPYPGISGGRQRSLNFLLELATAFKVTAIYPDGRYGSNCDEFLEKKGINAIRGLPVNKSVFSWTDGYFRDYPFHFAPWIEAVENDFYRFAPENNIIYIDHLHLSPLIRKKNLKSKFLILDEHNIESSLMETYFNSSSIIKRIPGHLYTRSMKKFEMNVLRLFNRIITAGEKDREEIIKWGIDPARIRNITNGAKLPSFIPEPVKRKTILYLGALNWAPNVSCLIKFYEKVFVRLLDVHPETVLIIGGSSPSSKFLNFFKDKPRVEIYPDFEDVSEMYSRSNILIVPSFVTGGTKIKCIEGLLHGRSVVSTRYGCENIPHMTGIHVCDSLKGFYQTLADLLSVNRLEHIDRTKLSEFSWDAVRTRFRDTIVSAIL